MRTVYPLGPPRESDSATTVLCSSAVVLRAALPCRCGDEPLAGCVAGTNLGQHDRWPNEIVKDFSHLSAGLEVIGISDRFQLDRPVGSCRTVCADMERTDLDSRRVRHRRTRFVTDAISVPAD